ncbi:MAG: ABC transporter permease [Candidatus Aminicenantes bacterium]|nr:ABC transporter permease [Candidatus Aminicenantes bacterium]
MKYEFFIAKRYLTAKRKQAFISVITFISVLGIAIGVMALVIAISGITGFHNDVQDKILGSTAHMMVSDLTKEGIEDYWDLIKEIEAKQGVVMASPVVWDMVMFDGPYKGTGGALRGIDFDLERQTSPWLNELEQGQIPIADSPKPGIVLGRELAYNIGAGVGDSIKIFTTAIRLSPMGPIAKWKDFEVTGIFHTGLYEFDASSALINLQTAQKIFSLDNKVNMIQVRISDIFKAPEIKEELESIQPEKVYVTTWMELNESLFSALKLEKKLLFLTITLIVIVAALNIIATLILMVMEKTRDIGVLKAMGAQAQSIKRIFFLQGAIIGVIGTTVGTFLGLAWCWLANTFELIKVPSDIYEIAFVPFRIKFFDLFIIVMVTLFISFLSTLFPAHRASKVDPVKALKYE